MEYEQIKEYLNGLDNMAIMLDSLPNLDDKSTKFYNEIYNIIDDEYERVTEIFKEENKWKKTL